MYSSQIIFDFFPAPPTLHAHIDNVMPSVIHGVSQKWLDHFIVEVPIPIQDPIGNLSGTGIPIRLGLNFDQARTNSAMTHVLVPSVKVRRNE